MSTDLEVWEIVCNKWSVTSYRGLLSEAVEFAQMLATEHYARTMNDTGTLLITVSGASFTTNNGTFVAYSVRH